ncbi:MAG: hypothetical protein KGJ12_04790, partial [Gammaproteobacteria bacterium]|nr:hypothetical protein [Gammaproteobacteria bacterium]
MNEPLSADSPIKTPSMVQLGYRVLLALACVSLGVVSLWLWLSWHSIKQQQLQRMGIVATMVAGQAENYFDVLGSRLETLSDRLRELDVLHRPQAALPVLQHFKAEYHDPADVTVSRPDGEILASTARTPNTVLSDASGNQRMRAGFENDRKVHGFSVHRPRFNRALNTWVIPLRYTARDAGGNVLFLIHTGITLDKQQALWRHLKLDMATQGTSVGLLRDDGYLISRFPMPDPHRLYGDRQMKGALFLATRNHAGTGRYEGLTADGMKRLGTYRRLSHYPVYAFMSVATSSVWETWWRYVRFPLYLLAGLMLIGSWIYIALARRFTRRMESLRARLGEVSDDHRDLLPSSGVREIDVLCSALADTQAKLNLAAKNQERLLLAAAEAGTYAVRASDGVIIAADHAFLAMIGLDEHGVVGRPWTALLADISERDGPHHDRGIVPRVLCFKRRDGQPVWLRLAEYLDQSAGETVRHGLAIDVSHREKLLFAVNTQSVRLQTLWQLATDRSMSDMEKVGLMLHLGLETFTMETAMIGEIVGDQYI